MFYATYERIWKLIWVMSERIMWVLKPIAALAIIAAAIKYVM